MAKTPTKTTAKKAAPKKAAAVKTAASPPDISRAAELALSKLKESNLDPQLQSDLEWCLGSYQHDQNPVGLYEMVSRSVRVFTVAKEQKAKGITAKLITDLEKSLATS